MAFAIDKIPYTISGSVFYSGPYKSNTVYGYLNHTSLQGWWRLNTNVSAAGNVTDSSGNSRTGTFDVDPDDRPAYAAASGPSTYIQTVSNTFDATNDAINIGSAVTWDALIGNDVAGGSTQQMTFSSWVYKTGDGGGGLGRIIEIGGSTGKVAFLTSNTSNFPMFQVTWGGSNVQWISAGAILEDAWVHVAVTYDANSLESIPLFYINGERQQTSLYGSAPSGTWNGIAVSAGYIGNNAAGSSGWEGSLADVAIWNTVLGESQIKALYNASLMPGPFNVTRDYNVIGTKADPPFTGSYAAAVQGKNVNTYKLFGTTIAPRMGRSDVNRILLSSSAGVTDITPSNYDYFNDSVTSPQPISQLSGSSASVEVIGNDASRVIALPQYELSPTTFGIEQINTSRLPWAAMNNFDPVVYLTEPEQIAYPVVMGNPSPIDPYDFNGAIEPIALRKPIAGHSTFIGSIEDPEPTGIRGAVSSGQTQQVFYARSVGCSNFYSVQPEVPIPFEAVGCSDEYQQDDSAGTLTQWVKPLPYTTNITGSFAPFVEKLPADQSFRNVSNFEMRNKLEEIFPGNQELGYPDALSRSSACGFDYVDSRGIESIAFGGLLK